MEHCSEVPEVNNGRVPNLGELDTPHDVSDNKKVRDVEENGELCSVCYECPDPLDEAMVPPCGHRFCVCCIARWASVKSTCALCKSEFSSLLVRRNLDGSPVFFDGELGWSEESLCLLLRARWLDVSKEDFSRDTNPMAINTQGSSHRGQHNTQDDWEYEDELELCCFEDEELSSGPTRRATRQMLGNRRFGETGFIRSGQMYARPRLGESSARKKRGKGKYQGE